MLSAHLNSLLPIVIHVSFTTLPQTGIISWSKIWNVISLFQKFLLKIPNFSLICMYRCTTSSVSCLPLSRLSRNEHRRCRAKRILFFVKPFSTILRHAEKGSSTNHKNICNKHVGTPVPAWHQLFIQSFYCKSIYLLISCRADKQTHKLNKQGMFCKMEELIFTG